MASRTRSAVVLLLAGMVSCTPLEHRGDHAAIAQLGRRLGRLAQALDGNALQHELLRVRAAARTTQQLLPNAQSLGQLPTALRRQADNLAASVNNTARAAHTATDLADRSVRRLGGMQQPDSALSVLSDPVRMVRRIRRAATETLPAVLDLRRQPLPSSTDARQQTGLGPPPPRESWLERLLRRLPL